MPDHYVKKKKITNRLRVNRNVLAKPACTVAEI